MSRPAGEHLTRISINIPTDDLDILKTYHPTGYQLKIRELVHEYCLDLSYGEALRETLDER